VAELNAFSRTLQWVDDNRTMWTEAQGFGRTCDDADLLIAAFTRRLWATLVTSDLGITCSRRVSRG